MTSDEIFRQQEELRRREQELQRRQQEFERRQQQPGGAGAPKPHNWPPIPGFVPVEPCFYHDIDVDIPVQFQETVKLVYYVYLVYVLALVFNIVASLFYWLFAGGGVGIFFLSIIQTILFTPCSFLFWYRPVYKAFRYAKSSFGDFHILILVVSGMTVPSTLWFSSSFCSSTAFSV